MINRIWPVGLLALAACSNGAVVHGGGAGYDALPLRVSAAPHTTTPIQHVVIVVQENRSFNNFFATFPGAVRATSGLTHTGKRVALKASNLWVADLDHLHADFLTEYDNGKMDGFDQIRFGATGTPAGLLPYQYVDPQYIAPYWSMAQQYVLADHMFATQSSGSFTAHQDLIAGGTAIDANESIVDFPSDFPAGVPSVGAWGCDAPQGTVTSLLTSSHRYVANRGPFPCFAYPTMRDVLDGANVSWRYYTPPDVPNGIGSYWNAFDAIDKVRNGPEWTTNVSSPETNVLKDVTAGSLPAVSWVIPDVYDSDHPGLPDYGPSWVAQIVNAIGRSKFWNSTAIVIVWDDWGGFYDPVAPPQLDYQGLGFRVPCIIVSPYARKGVVLHTRYEFGSILKFVEDDWSTARLGSTDERANSIADAFDFTQAPRSFVPIAAKYPAAFFERRHPSYRPVDDE